MQAGDNSQRSEPPGGTADGVTARRPVIERIVDQRLVKSLFDSARSTLIVGALVGCVVYFALWRTIGSDTIIYWLLGLTLVTGIRVLMIAPLKRRLSQSQVRRTGMIYAASAVVAGFVWAALMLFDDVSHPIGARIMILITLLGMPIASLSSNAIYRPVFFAFSLPIFAALFSWAWWYLPEMVFEFTLMSLAYMTLVTVIAHRYNRTLRRSLMRDIENEMLLHELNTANNELQRMAYQDPLTGLSNRRSFEESMTELLKRRRKHDTLALMLIDMDKFKWINDTLGHAAGDATLIELSRRIEQNSRANEMLAQTQLNAARIGGDEFIVVYRLDLNTSIEPLAARILDALTEPMEFEGTVHEPGVSIGIAMAPLHAEDLDGLLRAADEAMYAAKGAGGGRYVIAPAPSASAQSAI